MQKEKIAKILRENKQVLVVRKDNRSQKQEEGSPVSNFQLTEYMMN